MKVQSVSSVNVFNTCEEQYNHKYILKTEPLPDPKPEKMHLGSLIHAGIEATLKGADVAAALQKTATKDGIEAALVDKAYPLLNYYTETLGLGTDIVPVMHDCKPMVEFKINANINGVPFMGYIDAVVKLPDGRTALVDWKTRAGLFQSDNTVTLDQQLYVYAGALKHYYKIQIDAIAQVQLGTTEIPAVPTLKEGKAGTKASDYSKVIRKTTVETLAKALGHLDEEEFVEALVMFGEKTVPLANYVRWTWLNTKHVNPMLKLFLAKAKAIDNTTDFVPVFHSYTCVDCAYRIACGTKHFGT